ncbi:hypothetical protein DN068_04570 [Taibaiella soli]|uniref:Uncharacterized protein n=2 Tax=Taibaiella soli TaxID=1649169 RepID=A0A2W2BEF9_9BACT|nr:hypothetical protein DN068_04570 [Taibaiella soli]
MKVSAQEKPAMRKMQDTLKEITIHSQSVKPVLHSAREYVVDYDFVDGYILVASYSSPNRKDPKLFLLSKAGDTASLLYLPEAPDELFKSCAGQMYCVSSRAMYPLEVDTGNLSVRQAYDLSVFDQLKTCSFATQNQYYYKIADRQHFNILYAYRKKDDSVWHPGIGFDDAKTRDASNEEWGAVLALLAGGNPSGAAKQAGMRHLLNKNAYAYLDQPLFPENDKIRSFDFRSRQICTYDLDGRLMESVAMRFDFRNVQRMEVIKDPVTNEYYLHRSDNNAGQTLARIDLQTGALFVAIPIEKPFISKLKVFDSEIYYLFQNPAEPDVQQLYVQRGF